MRVTAVINLYFPYNSSENRKESMTDEEKKESCKAEDPFKVDCTE